MAIKIPPLIRMSSGLVFLTVSILLLADLIGIAPNQSDLIVDERRKFSEFLTIQIMSSIDKGQEESIPAIMNLVIERNDDILSSAIRTIDGEIILETGDHKDNWNLEIDDGSTTDFIQVPVFKDGEDWGRIELRYRSFNQVSKYLDLPINDNMLLTLFVAVLGYILFSLFLKRTLRHLDPSAVIPSRVRNAMNALSEGVLILDNKENIILANSSICKKMGLSEKELVGKKISKFPWQLKGNKSDQNNSLPWQTVLSENISVSSVELQLDIASKGVRTFVVNASPVEGEENKITGLLCTFDDVTHIEEKNSELQSAMVLLEETQIQINKKNEELSLLASTDPLTECLNRRAFFEVVDEEFINTNDDNLMACIMLDIDFFKKVNDDYGHTVGDIVIKALADTLKNTLRENDLLCRYGGEEFCIILKDTNAATAFNLAERARQQVENLKFMESPATEKMTISASFGITDTSFDAENVEQLIDQADQALYSSKDNGRNKVTLWGDVILIEKEGDSLQEIDIFQDENIKNLVQEDILTGLPDRQCFMQVINDAIMSEDEQDEVFAIILIDIDMFKRINRSLGSIKGDLLLQQFTQRLSDLVRSSDYLALYEDSTVSNSIVSRVGGNEFAIMAKEFKDISNVHIIANRLMESLSLPYLLDDTEIVLTMSLGISVYPMDAKTSESLVSNSELALLRAKKEEGNTYRRFKKDVDITPLNTMSIENELRNAIKNREFILYYQPKVDLSKNEVNSVEALIRWNHPEKGIIAPDNFITVAENCGLIHEIGKQVMEMAFEQTVEWVNEGSPFIRVAINISPLQLKKQNFLQDVYSLLDQYSCDPSNIEFELTETVLVENIDLVLPILKNIHEKGIQISIDDFGVGYSSLNYIKHLPIDIIKIDKSFVDDIHTETDDLTLVSAIIAMAHAMKLQVVAEGVENKQQLTLLQNLKCNYIQGFYFSKPVPPVKISGLLQRLRPGLSKATG